MCAYLSQTVLVVVGKKCVCRGIVTFWVFASVFCLRIHVSGVWRQESGLWGSRGEIFQGYLWYWHFVCIYLFSVGVPVVVYWE